MNPTEELYLTEPNTRVCTARIVQADGRGIRLDRTLFHPEGDGQPGDTGLFEPPDGNDIVIVDCFRDEDGTPVHVSQPGTAVPEVGTRINMVLNWERRLRLMRLHSALHLVSALVGGARVGASEVDENNGWLEFDLARELPQHDDLQRELERLIESDKPITARRVDREELQALQPRLAARPPAGDDPVMLVEIPSLDLQVCRGVHTATTRAIGAVEIVRVERRGRLLHRIDLRLG